MDTVSPARLTPSASSVFTSADRNSIPKLESVNTPQAVLSITASIKKLQLETKQSLLRSHRDCTSYLQSFVYNRANAPRQFIVYYNADVPQHIRNSSAERASASSSPVIIRSWQDPLFLLQSEDIEESTVLRIMRENLSQPWGYEYAKLLESIASDTSSTLVAKSLAMEALAGSRGNSSVECLTVELIKLLIASTSSDISISAIAVAGLLPKKARSSLKPYVKQFINSSDGRTKSAAQAFLRRI